MLHKDLELLFGVLACVEPHDIRVAVHLFMDVELFLGVGPGLLCGQLFFDDHLLDDALQKCV